MPTFDGHDPKQGGKGLLPPGPYRMKITSATDVVTPTGTEGVEIELEVTMGPETGGGVRDTMWFTPKAMPYTRYNIEAAGVAVPSGEFKTSMQDPHFAAMCAALIGRLVDVVVVMEPDYKDPTKSWPRVRSYEKPSGAPPMAAAGASTSTRDETIPF